MWIPPIIERELRIALRRHNARSSRFNVAAWGAGLATVFLLFGSIFGSRSWPGTLHFWLSLFGLYLAVAPSLNISVGLFCEERKNQTLELLYLAGMNSLELFFGKISGGILIASADLLALTPVLAIPFLSGGVSLDLFLATVACFPMVLLFVVAMGTLASVLCRDDGTAWICAVVMIGAACLAVPLPYHLGNAVAGTPPFSADWLCLSPAYGPYLVVMKFYGGSPGMFWLSWAITLGWTVIALGVAAWVLSRNWRAEIVYRQASGWQGKWETWVRGSSAWRASLRERLLPMDTYQWLTEQDRRPMLMAWGWVAGIAVLWLAGWCAWPRVWASPVNFFITAVLMLIGVDSIKTYTAARRLGTDRRDGVLELLLTTPLCPEEIADGQTEALERQFRGLKLFIATLFTLMILGGYATRSWTLPSLISYGIIWAILFGWCFYPHRARTAQAMWIALNVGRPAAALFPKRQGRWGWWNWIFNIGFNGRSLWRGLFHASGFPTGSVLELFIVGVFGLFTFIIAVARIYAPDPDGMRRKLIDNMRSIARMPVPDRNDPRLKKWVVTQQLPEPAGDYVSRYPERMLQAEANLPKTTTYHLGRWAGRQTMRLARSTGRMAGRIKRGY